MKNNKDIDMTDCKELYEIKCSCCEIHNLYVDNDINLKITKTILRNIEDWSSKNEKPITYAYIYHDRDVAIDDEFDQYHRLKIKKGQLKKSHYHLYISLPYSMCIGDIAIKLGCDYQRIQVVKPQHFDNKLMYLTHLCHQDKYQYPITDIKTNIFDYIQYVYQKHRDDLPVIPLICQFLTCSRTVTFTEIIIFLQERNIYGKQLKDNWGIIRDLVNEHNRIFRDDIYLEDIATRKGLQHLAKIRKEQDTISKLVNVFDRCTIEDDNGKKTEIMKIK